MVSHSLSLCIIIVGCSTHLWLFLCDFILFGPFGLCVCHLPSIHALHVHACVHECMRASLCLCVLLSVCLSSVDASLSLSPWASVHQRISVHLSVCWLVHFSSHPVIPALQSCVCPSAPICSCARPSACLSVSFCFCVRRCVCVRGASA